MWQVESGHGGSHNAQFLFTPQVSIAKKESTTYQTPADGPAWVWNWYYDHVDGAGYAPSFFRIMDTDPDMLPDEQCKSLRLSNIPVDELSKINSWEINIFLVLIPTFYINSTWSLAICRKTRGVSLISLKARAVLELNLLTNINGHSPPRLVW